jgi:ATP-dependent helicase HrpB
MLAARALDAGLGRFVDLDDLNAFRARTAFAATQSAGLRPIDDDSIATALRSLCEGVRSFAELETRTRDGGLIAAIESQMPANFRARIEQLAPSRIRLPNGRNVRVNYEAGKPPWIASRLQDFFGMKETPRIAGGTVPLVVHLLAPNQRPVQMTADLSGFWSRLYPQVRRELSRRYPKHSWPENPLMS